MKRLLTPATNMPGLMAAAAVAYAIAQAVLVTEPGRREALALAALAAASGKGCNPEPFCDPTTKGAA